MATSPPLKWPMARRRIMLHRQITSRFPCPPCRTNPYLRCPTKRVSPSFVVPLKLCQGTKYKLYRWSGLLIIIILQLENCCWTLSCSSAAFSPPENGPPAIGPPANGPPAKSPPLAANRPPVDCNGCTCTVNHLYHCNYVLYWICFHVFVLAR